MLTIGAIIPLRAIMRWSPTLIPPSAAVLLVQGQRLTALGYAFIIALAALFAAATLTVWGVCSKVFGLPFRED